MKPRTRALVGVIIISVLLLVYLASVGVRAVALLGSGELIGVVMGAALLVLPLIGVWALARELIFGRDATRLVDRLEAEGLLPDEEVGTHPSGRPDRAQADAMFPKYQAEAEAAPDSWQVWARLGIVYDACGDRKRARAALREAIACDRKVQKQ
ncbi:MAG: hypothetical protein ACTHZ9_07035 [Leucobacter sp.]